MVAGNIVLLAADLGIRNMLRLDYSLAADSLWLHTAVGDMPVAADVPVTADL